MDINDVEQIADAATELFRMETFQTYLVEHEKDEFTAWKQGRHRLPAVDDDPWLSYIRDKTAAGARWWRVRIVDHPMTAYTEFELHGLQGNAAAGEDVLVADRAWSPDLAGLHEDYWIFDTTVIRMVYDAEGHFLRPELVGADTASYFAERDLAARHAVPLATFLAHHAPRLIA